MSYSAGHSAESSGSASVAVGAESKSSGDYSLALGSRAQSDGINSIAIGLASRAYNKDSIAVGRNVVNDGEGSIAIGGLSDSTGIYSLSLGSWARSLGIQSIAIGTDSYSTNDDSVALGTKAKTVGKNSVAVGIHSHSTDDDSVALGSSSRAERKYDDKKLRAIRAEQDDKLGLVKIREVSLGARQKTENLQAGAFSQITHVAPGTEDTDAVNLYQLKKVKRKLEDKIGKVDEIETTKNKVEQFETDAKGASEATTNHRDNAKIALTETTVHRDNAKSASEMAKTALTEIKTHRDNVYDALTMVKAHENSADSIVKRLKREVLLAEGEITQGSDGTMYIGRELKGSQIFVSGKQGDRVISGVANGVRNRDAVNVSQLNTVRTTANYASQLAQKNSSRINHLEDRLSKTNTKIERGLATSAALTGLFQPYGVGKVNFTASIGGYGASQALAVGTGYRITENAAVKRLSQKG